MFLLTALLFLIANRAAYKGWFNDDDLDNLLWTRHTETVTFLKGLASPRFAEFNFRPTGHLYYHLLVRNVGVEFRWYVALLHVFHMVNVWLVWAILRRTGLSAKGALAGTLFFAFHIALFDAWWKPMFVFDVLCGTFSFLTVLLYLSGHWVWALAPFWLAYKAKELAVAVPVFLLLYELIPGERRWKRLLPYFAIAASFSVQGVLSNRAVDNDYSLRFTLDALRKTSAFYLSKVLLFPYSGFVLLPLAALWPGERARWRRWAVLGFLALLGPLWFLPGRLFAVYLYVPMLAVALLAGNIAERAHPACVALFFALWLPGNYRLLRMERAVALNVGPENKAWFEAVGSFLKANPGLERVVYDGHPPHLAQWGVDATFRWYRPLPDFEFMSFTDPKTPAALQRMGTGIVSWESVRRRLLTSVRTEKVEISWIDFSKDAPIMLLEEGWFGLEWPFRWTMPRAKVRLLRPEGAKEFVVYVNLGPGQQKAMGSVNAEVLLDGVSLGKRQATKVAWQEMVWELRPGTAGPVMAELVVDPPFVPGGGDPRQLGAAVLAIGFRPNVPTSGALSLDSSNSPGKHTCDFRPYRPVRISSEWLHRQGILSRVEPEYPVDAKAKRIQGRVNVRILINAQGNVEQACGDGDERLRRAAENAAKNWKFNVPKINGVSLPYVEEVLRFNFVLGR